MKKCNHSLVSLLLCGLGCFFDFRCQASNKQNFFYAPRSLGSFLLFVFLGFVKESWFKTPANLDRQFDSMSVWDGGPSAHSGPEGFESSAQSAVEIGTISPRHQKLLEIFAQGHASSQGATVRPHSTETAKPDSHDLLEHYVLV